MAGYRFLRCFIPFLVGLACAAQQPSAGKAVDLTAADGVHLKATYFAGKPGPGILLLHQCNQTRTAWQGLAERLASTGFNVLTMDYRGFGESGGAPFDKMTPQEQGKLVNEQWPADIDVALKFLSSQQGVKPEVTGVGGASCGVNQSIQAARRHPEVKSLVLLSGGTDREGRQFLQKSPALPIFIASADDDSNGIVSQIMDWLHGMAANPGNRFVRYPTGGHGNEIFAERKELPGMIVDWFETTLVKTPGKAPASEGTARPASSKVLAMIDEPGGAAKAAQLLADARKKSPSATIFPEFIVNLLGYEHLQSGDIPGATEILKLNVTAFPNSANAYDSLSDAYAAAGEKDLALQTARKALELLPSDKSLDERRRNAVRQSAEQKLKQLGGEQAH